MTKGQRRKALDYLRSYPIYRLSADYVQLQLKSVPLVGEPGSPQRLESIRKRRTVRRRIRNSRVRVAQVELGLRAMTPVQRLVVEKLCIHPVKGNAERLCQMLGCEKSTVYRHRERALERFVEAVWG